MLASKRWSGLLQWVEKRNYNGSTVLAPHDSMFFCTLSFPPSYCPYYPEPLISAAAVRGVHWRRPSVHQVADGERPGLDHLFCCGGKLQGGCKQDFMATFYVVLYVICCLRCDFSLRQVDLTELLESWAARNVHIITDRGVKVKPVWRDASFTLKYYSDALFDFPHWFGFSKRKFKVNSSSSSSQQHPLCLWAGSCLMSHLLIAVTIEAETDMSQQRMKSKWRFWWSPLPQERLWMNRRIPARQAKDQPSSWDCRNYFIMAVWVQMLPQFSGWTPLTRTFWKPWRLFSVSDLILKAFLKTVLVDLLLCDGLCCCRIRDL